MTVAEERAPVEFELSARYRAGAAPVLLTGVQAIARMLVEQHAADARAGLSHGVVRLRLPGQPAGRARPDPGPRHRAAGERGPHARARGQRGAGRHRGVGQPGRGARRTAAASTAWSASGTARGPASTARATRCATATCAAPTRRGGVLVLAGDDPSCKSSTDPVHLRAHARWATGCRCSTRGTAEEIVRLGRYGIALSRASGMWVGMKITADVADGVYAVDARQRPARSRCPELRVGGRALALPAVPDARAAGIARGRGADCTGRAGRWSARSWPPTRSTPSRSTRPTRGWASWPAARRSPTSGRPCATSASTTTALARAGIRLLRLGMIHPIERGQAPRVRRPASTRCSSSRRSRRSSSPPSATRSTACPTRPPSSGQTDATGAPLVPVAGELTAGALTGPLRRVLGDRVRAGPAAARARRVCRCWRSGAPPTSAPAARTTARRSCPRARSRAAASAATRWWRSPAAPRARSPRSRRWAARARSGSGRRRSPTPGTCSRTWATARSPTPGSSPCRRAWRPGCRSPTSCCSTGRSP